jgi:hypothetical protein
MGGGNEETKSLVKGYGREKRLGYTGLTDGSKVVSCTRRPAALYSQEDSWYSFLLEAESTPGPQFHSARTSRDQPTCGTVPQATRYRVPPPP